MSEKMSVVQIFRDVCLARCDYHHSLFINKGGKKQLALQFFDPKTKQKRKPISDDLIKKHIAGDYVIVASNFLEDGIHVKSGKCDFDAHAKDSVEKEKEIKIIHQHIKLICQELDRLGYLYYLHSSNSEGIHLNVYSNEPILAKTMHFFLHDLQKRILGESFHEVFPTQLTLNAQTPIGYDTKIVLAKNLTTGKIAGVIPDYNKLEEMLDKQDSILFLANFRNIMKSAKPIIFEVTKQMEDSKKPKLEMSDEDIDDYNEKNTPKFCPFFEEIACKEELPSGKLGRHQYLDPMLYIYSTIHNNKEAYENYCLIQQRNDSAFNGQAKGFKWSCKLIGKYLSLNEGKSIETAKLVCKNCTNPCKKREYHDFKTIRYLDESVLNIKSLIKENYNSNQYIQYDVGRQIMIEGKLFLSQYSYKESISLLKVFNDKDDLLIFQFINDKKPSEAKKAELIAEFKADFYIYQMIYHNKLYSVLSEKELELMDYKLYGDLYEINDKMDVGHNSSLSNNTGVLILNEAQPYVLKFEDKTQFFNYIKPLHLTKDRIMDWLLFNPGDFEKYDKGIYRQMPNMEDLLLTTLFNYKLGVPLHIWIIGGGGTGKSLILKLLNKRVLEAEGILDGGTSRLKGIIPSFKENPPRPGKLNLYRRFGYLDELLRLVAHIPKEDREDSLGALLNVLDHAEGTSASGVGDYKGKASCQVIAVSNPTSSFKSKDIIGLTNNINQPLLSRFIIYFQREEDNVWNTNLQGYSEQTPELILKSEDFVNILDFLKSFNSNYDKRKLKEFTNVVFKDSPENLEEMYRRIANELASKILDGIIKMRCIFTNDMSFNVIEEDYIKTVELIKVIVKNWFDSDNLKLLQSSNKWQYLSEYSKVILNQIKDSGFVGVSAHKLKSFCSEEKIEYETVVNELKKMELIRRLPGNTNVVYIYVTSQTELMDMM